MRYAGTAVYVAMVASVWMAKMARGSTGDGRDGKERGEEERDDDIGGGGRERAGGEGRGEMEEVLVRTEDKTVVSTIKKAPDLEELVRVQENVLVAFLASKCDGSRSFACKICANMLTPCFQDN
eukprot:750180-Hanusia_phi.AAC.1